MHSKMTKFAEMITDIVNDYLGSWTFIVWFLVLSVIYMGINLTNRAWDVYPFVFLNLMLGFLSSLSAPIIMMSAAHQDKKKSKKQDQELLLTHKIIERLEKIEHLLLNKKE